MKPLSLRARMFAWFSGLASVLVLGTSAAHYLQTREALLESLDSQLRERADAIGMEDEDEELREEAAGDTARPHDVRGFEVYEWPALSLVARSASLSRGDPPLCAARLTALVGANSRAGADFAISTSLVRGGDVRVLGAVFQQGRRGTRLVVVVEDLAEVQDELGEVLGGFVVTLPIALLLAGAGAWLAARHLTRPLRDMTAAADRVETGGARTAMPSSGAGDEIDRLAATLDRAFARLARAYERQARFSADAAHELRTPVSVVLSQAEVALRRDRTPDEYRSTLTQVVEAARRMQQTLEALLLLARGDAGDLDVRGARVDLADVARDAAAWCAAEADARSVAVRVESPRPAFVTGDARLLGIVVRNLLANALAYSPAGGSVGVAVTSGDTGVVLVVRDEGPGIPHDALPHVFERFFRVDDSRSRATGGSGLGLSLVRLLAQAHGGAATAESAPGRGTRITVRLPAATA